MNFIEFIETCGGIFKPKAARETFNQKMGDMAKDMYDFAKNHTTVKNATEVEKTSIIKKIIPEEYHEILSKKGKPEFQNENKTNRDIIFHFFGMNEDWPVWRCLIGGFMVHCPEYPTYFIPAYTQSKATGSAGELKKGEGPRGLITGGLEGVAVGALVSGRIMKVREMIPYILLGMGLQYISSKFFPWLGEKLGKPIYVSKQIEKSMNKIPLTEIKPIEKSLVKKPPMKDPKTTFTSIYNPNINNNSRIKI